MELCAKYGGEGRSATNLWREEGDGKSDFHDKAGRGSKVKRDFSWQLLQLAKTVF